MSNTQEKTTQLTEQTDNSKEKTITTLSFEGAENLNQAMQMLSEYVSNNGLSREIAGRNYILVEGWQYIATLFGLLPNIEGVEDLSNGSHYKYRAQVVLIDRKTGEIFARAWASCSNKENKKQSFGEYAVESMAQTRAIGKVCRNTFGFLARGNGYEATPYEEMDETNTDNRPYMSVKYVNESLIPWLKNGETNKVRNKLAEYRIPNENAEKRIHNALDKMEAQQYNLDELDNVVDTTQKKTSNTPQKKSQKNRQKMAGAIEGEEQS